jgi:hypothetical protein
VTSDNITKRNGYRASLVVMIAGLAMIIGIALKSNMREQRMVSMTPASLVIKFRGDSRPFLLPVSVSGPDRPKKRALRAVTERPAINQPLPRPYET